jgi:hypothetical protein
MIINIISSPKGGGAELLVRELHRIYLAQDLDSQVIYLSGSSSDIGPNEKIIDSNHRNPLNIFRIRRQLKLYLEQSESEIVVHAHLIWSFFTWL